MNVGYGEPCKNFNEVTMKINWVKESFLLFYDCIIAGFHFIRGVYTLSRLEQPIISIFGGKRAPQENGYTKQAYDLARMLAKQNISVLTGGGPGIMEAANCGAASIEKEKKDNKRRTVGIGVRGVDAEFVNPCAYVFHTRYLYIRKWLLMHYSRAFIVFPGGIGTCEELFELLDLMKLEKIKQYPVILIGSAYWRDVLNWYNEAGIKQGYIPAQAKDFITVTDDINQAYSIINKALSKN